MFRIEPLDILRDWEWVSREIRCHLVEDTGGLVAFDDKGDYAGAIVFDSFTPTACYAHIVIKKRLLLKHRFLHLGFEAVFSGLKRKVILLVIASSNTKALAFATHLGFFELVRVRDVFGDGVDSVVFEMRHEDCRWLSKEGSQHGQKISA